MTTYANYITVDGKIYYPDRPVIEAFHEAVAQLAEAQAKLQETCLQVAGAVWATAAPDKVVDIQTCVDIVKRIMQEQTK